LHVCDLRKGRGYLRRQWPGSNAGSSLAEESHV
jgi:hypothetical protein